MAGLQAAFTKSINNLKSGDDSINKDNALKNWKHDIIEKIMCDDFEKVVFISKK